MPKKSTIIACILTILIAGYLCFALNATAKMARNDMFTGCRINVADSVNTGFVTELDISRECGDIKQWITQKKRSDINLNELESHLRASDKVENVNVSILNNGVLAIDIVPMTPVARVFDGDSSYYINASGKRISADPRYQVDVPVVVGTFSDKYPPSRLLPLLDYIASHPELDALVSTVKQTKRGDIYIIPTIRGHVVNFGDTSLVADKFNRLRKFYRKVMPVRGWETYDTLSVKWRGQLVATRRNKELNTSMLASNIEEFDDIDDAETILTPNHFQN